MFSLDIYLFIVKQYAHAHTLAHPYSGSPSQVTFTRYRFENLLILIE